MYLSHTDGNETPYIRCPECSAEAYVIEEQRCALYEYEAEHRCAMCAGSIPPEELAGSPLCGWCDHMMSKDDSRPGRGHRGVYARLGARTVPRKERSGEPVPSRASDAVEAPI
jgi:hypothetical protein